MSGQPKRVDRSFFCREDEESGDMKTATMFLFIFPIQYQNLLSLY